MEGLEQAIYNYTIDFLQEKAPDLVSGYIDGYLKVKPEEKPLLEKTLGEVVEESKAKRIHEIETSLAHLIDAVQHINNGEENFIIRDHLKRAKEKLIGE